MNDQDLSRLSYVFDIGMRNGFDSLSPEDRELFLIQDFLIELDMSGLSGYFEKRLFDPPMVEATIDSMKRRGLAVFGALLDEAFTLFRGCTREESEAETWVEIKQRYDPVNRLDAIWEEMLQMEKYC